MNPKIIRAIYLLAVTVAAGRFFTLGVHGFLNVPIQNWGQINGWKNFFVSLLAYGACAGAAFVVFEKRKSSLSVSSFFVIFLFGFYFLQLINVFGFHFNETVFLKICFLAMIASAVWIARGGMTLGYTKKKMQAEEILTGLITALWLIASLFYLFEYNLSEFRQPYSDEVTLWYTAAHNILRQSAAFAHQVNYPGGGHPLGVPFIAALPGQIFQGADPATIFFLPLVVIISLAAFLWRLRQQKWIFFFFTLALFSSFNQREWAGDLMYRLVYAAGISTVLFLLIVHELYKLSEKKQDGPIWGVAVLSGLAALSQSVFVLMIPVFGILVIAACGNTHSRGGKFSTPGPACHRPWRDPAKSGDRQAGWGKGILFLIAAGLPYGVWKAVIAMPQGQSHDMVLMGRHLQENIFNPRWGVLGDIFQYGAEQAEGLHYFFILSILLILISRDRKIILTASAVFAFVGFIICFIKRKGRYLFFLVWFFAIVILGGTITIDAPSSQRLVGLIPVLFLFAGVALEQMMKYKTYYLKIIF